MTSPMRFTRVQVDELDPGPLPVPFHDSTMGPFTHWKVNWLQLTADDGVVGQATGNVSPEVARVLVNEGPCPLEEWWRRVFWMLRNQGHRNPATSGTLHGLEMALRDILAQRAGQPWHRCAGAGRDRVPVYGSGGGTHLSVDQLVAEMKDMATSGFTTLKMKVGSSFGTRMQADLERVRAVRQAVGDRIALALDANQTWTPEEALRFIRLAADHDIAWFEEPVHSADRAAIREICRTSPVPVSMGESENHWLGFRDLVECGVAHLQPNPHALPGLTRWAEAVDFAEAAGRTWSSGGFSHLAAMYVATRNGGMVEFLRPINGHLATVFAEKPTIAGGWIHLPDTVGLPVKVDWAGLQRRNAIRSLLDVKA